MRPFIFALFLSVGVIAACSPSSEEMRPVVQDENTLVMNQNNVLSGKTDLSSLQPENLNKNTNKVLINPSVGGTVIHNMDTSAKFEVVSVDMDYQDKNPLFKRNVADAYQLVRIGMRVTGASEKAFPFDNLNFSLDTPKVKAILESELGTAQEVQDHLVQQLQLGMGKAVQGALYFEVAKGLTRQDLVLSYESLVGGKSREYKIEL